MQVDAARSGWSVLNWSKEGTTEPCPKKARERSTAFLQCGRVALFQGQGELVPRYILAQGKSTGAWSVALVGIRSEQSRFDHA